MSKSKDPCVKFSCVLEKCTTRNNFQADKCKKELNQLLDCCRKFGPKLAPCCAGFHELDDDFKKLESISNETWFIIICYIIKTCVRISILFLLKFFIFFKSLKSKSSFSKGFGWYIFYWCSYSSINWNLRFPFGEKKNKLYYDCEWFIILCRKSFNLNSYNFIFNFFCKFVTCWDQ